MPPRLDYSNGHLMIDSWTGQVYSMRCDGSGVDCSDWKPENAPLLRPENCTQEDCSTTTW